MGPAKRRPRHEARQARNDVYRQHIVAAAEQVFAERGFDATKVQDISKQVAVRASDRIRIVKMDAEKRP